MVLEVVSSLQSLINLKILTLYEPTLVEGVIRLEEHRSEPIPGYRHATKYSVLSNASITLWIDGYCLAKH